MTAGDITALTFRSWSK